MTKVIAVSSSPKRGSVEWWASLPPEKTGKETENIVEKLFTEWNSRANFAWHRLPDAHSSRGRTPAQPADYLWANAPDAGFLEVKALKHPVRLPADRVTQLPTLKKFRHAGMLGLVLVHHYMDQKWRCISVDDLEFGVPSWELSGHPCFSNAEGALRSMGYFS